MIIFLAAISILVYAVIVAVATLVIKKVWLTHKKKAKIQTYAYSHPQNYQDKKGTIHSPTGWIWDEETKTWVPPDSLVKESKEQWEWDPVKKIWIDKTK